MVYLLHKNIFVFTFEAKTSYNVALVSGKTIWKSEEYISTYAESITNIKLYVS